MIRAMQTLTDFWSIVQGAQAGLPDKPVDVIRIAKEVGVPLYQVHDWEDDLSGMIKRVGDGFEIYVNGRHAVTRQRFTIAHELAHLFLHEWAIGDGIVDDALYRSGLSSELESEANSMAADILMPRKVAAELWSKPENDLARMAKVFGVSKSAMAIRLGVPVD